jgi:hypothetical protein
MSQTMDRSPEITGTPEASQANLIDGSSPQVAFSGPVTLSIARDEQTIAGHIIVTFAKSGPLTCTDLLKYQTTADLLSHAETHGVSISEPALLAVTSSAGEARTIYITPPPQNNFRDFAIWVGQVSETLSNLKAKNVGFYLCKDSLPNESLMDLVSQVVRSAVDAQVAMDISLVVGNYPYNEILAMALELKQELESTQTSVHVIH